MVRKAYFGAEAIAPMHRPRLNGPRASALVSDMRSASFGARSGVLLVAIAVAACSATSSPSPATTPSGQPSASPVASASGASPAASFGDLAFVLETFPVPAGSHPHDVAPAAEGGVWYTAQRTGRLGWLDPATGEVREIPLGAGSSPHGVIVGPDDAPWITDSGLNAILRVDPETEVVRRYPLPSQASGANLNTATFDRNGKLWFTGQAGWYGRLDPASEVVEVWEAPRGRGPYGITATPAGDIYFASLAGSYLGQVDIEDGSVTVLEPPTPAAGVRRAWSDSAGRIWVAEWDAGQVGVYDPADGSWQEWPLPGESPQAYAVYVDELDAVWLTEFTADAILRFDPSTETFRSFPAQSLPSAVRQLLGRPSEVWGAESAADRLVVVRYTSPGAA
jgi:virginiamycin B lyase